MISGENIRIKMLKDVRLPRQTSIDKNTRIRWLFVPGDIKKNVDNVPHVPLFEKL